MKTVVEGYQKSVLAYPPNIFLSQILPFSLSNLEEEKRKRETRENKEGTLTKDTRKKKRGNLKKIREHIIPQKKEVERNNYQEN